MRQKLLKLQEQGRPVRVAVIGCGRFGSMVISQLAHAPGMELSIACDLDVTRAVEALSRESEFTMEHVRTKGLAQANDAISQHRPVVTDNPDIAIQAEVDVVVEATGNPDAGAEHVFDAIMEGRHVVNVNVEADVLVGPILKRMADSAGVVYSLAYGDQPAIIDELYDWATSLGYEVVTAGKGTMHLDENRYSTPDEALARYGYTSEDVQRMNLNPKMYNSFIDTTKSCIEMCAVANMTGLVPDVPGMHFPSVGIQDIPKLLIPADDGGILSKRGVVEVVSSHNPDGSEIDDHLRWGVYVVITSDSPYLRACMRDYGMPMDPTGSYALMYRPYHLIGMEALVSIGKAAVYGEPTGAPQSRVAEVAAAAKRNLDVGDVLDGEGGSMVYGNIVEAQQADVGQLVPIGLSNGAKLLNPVSRGMMVRYGDVEMPEERFAASLRRKH